MIERFHIPVDIRFGAGALAELTAVARALGGRRVLAILSAGGARRWRDRLQSLLGHELQIYAQATSNPTVRDAEQAIEEARRAQPDWIVAFGGGSALDLAKVVALCVRGGSVSDAVRNADALDSLPVVAIPTTSGTASEVTRFATLWDDLAKKKLSVDGERVFPRFALVDPDLCMSMPARVTATSGMDALSHALESYWSRRAQPTFDAISLEVVRQIVAHLPIAVEVPGDRVARSAMARAALLAGLVIGHTKTAAAHAMSYPLTLRHGVEHGLACSITLPALLPINAVELGDARARALFVALGADDALGASRVLTSMANRCGLPTRLRDLGVVESDLDLLLSESFTPGRMDNNVRALDRQLVRQVLDATY